MPASTAVAAPAGRPPDAPKPPAPPNERRLPWRTRLVDPNDPRYPRTGWKAAARWLLRWAWVGFVAYITYAGGQLAPSIINGQPVTADQLAQAFLVGRILPVVQHLALAAWVAPLVLLALVIVAGRVAHLDHLHEKAVLRERDEFKELVPYYKLKPVAKLDPNSNDVQLAKYVRDVYLNRRVAGSDIAGRADAQARAALRDALAAAQAGHADPDAPLGILVVGRPTLGKTRCAFEAMRAVLPTATFVSWPTSGTRAPTFDFTLVAGRTVVLWLDNLQDYAGDPDARAVSDLPGRFSASQLVVVATSRDGADYDRVEGTLKSLTRRLATIPLDDITPGETQTLIQELEERQVKVVEDARDGTPGALLLDVAGMIKRYGDKHFPQNARSILKAMKLLRAAGTNAFLAARVRAVGHALFDLPDTLGAWQNAVDVLVRQDFVRLGPLDTTDNLRALVAVADVYLDRAVNDYLATSAQLGDQWLLLADVLARTRDTDALFRLGYTANALKSGLDPARPWDLLSARQLAARCYRAYLELAPPDDADRPGAENNLGNALRDLHQPEAALAAFERALTLDPTYANAWNGKGNVLVDLHQPEAALAAYERALTLDPQTALIMRNIADLLCDDLHRFADALAMCDRALAIEPDSARGWSIRAEALRGLGREADAEAAEARAKALGG